MRNEFQELNKKFEIGCGTAKIIETVERKLQIAKIVDSQSQAVFHCLMECWLAYEGMASLDQVAAVKAAQYKKEAARYANILGPASGRSFVQVLTGGYKPLTSLVTG